MRAVALLIAAGCVPNGRTSARQRLSDAGVIAPDAASPMKDAGDPMFPDASEPAIDAGQPVTDAGDLCIDGPSKPAPTPRANVYYGTDLPSYAPMTDGQILAIGTFFGCSGLVITPTWVLTAKHCGLSPGATFCIGPQPDDPNLCFTGTRVADNPSGDMTLVELDRPATDLAPSVVPVPILGEDMDTTWIGRTAEAAGYGQNENGGSGRREFTAEPISDLDGDLVTINGQGQHGVCFGDSGGPVFVVASDGSVRVAGALSYGDPSCVGYDNFTRTDVYRDWIEGLTGPAIPPGPQPCGDITAEGLCADEGRRASWCGPNDELVTDACETNELCAFSPSVNGYRCVDRAADPCRGTTYDGACANDVLTWCDRGVLLSRDCGACGESCLPLDPSGFYCVASTCGDVDFLGKCEGDTAIWCNRNGQLEERNCAEDGQTCGFVDADIGYFCE
jgi:hypothetical protein